MGFRFRRAFGIVPGVRLNLGLRGPSISLGPRGLHYTIGLRGTRTTVGIPGSGISWTGYHPYSSRHRSRSTAPPDVPHTGPSSEGQKFLSNDPTATVYDSAAIEQLVAASTSELAPVLDAARKHWGFAPIVLALALSVLVLAVMYNSQPGIAGAILFGIVAWPLSAFLDHRRRTVRLEYNLQDNQILSFNGLIGAFKEFATSQRVWRVPLQMNQRDWKRNAGATILLQREKISPHLALPSLVQRNLKFPTLRVGKETIYLAPDAILVVAKNSVAALRYDEVEIDTRPTRFSENEEVPSDSHVVGETWQFVNKKGGPDRRFANNRKLPICVCGEIDFRSKSGLNERIQCSKAENATQFASSIIAMRLGISIPRQ